jgi:MFS family permease
MLIFIVFSLNNFMNYYNRGLISTILVNLTKELNMTWEDQSFIMSSFILGYVISSFISSLLSKKYYPITILLLGTLFGLSGNILMYLCNNKYLLFISRCLIGCGDGSFQCLGPTILKKNYDSNFLDKYLSIFYIVINVGVGIGCLMGGLILDWQYLLIIPIISQIILLIILYKIHNNFVSGNIELKKSIILFFKNKILLYSVFAYTFLSLSLSTINFWLPTFLHNTFVNNQYNEIIVLYSIIFIISSLLTMFIFPLILKKTICKFNEIKILILFCIVSVFFMFIFVFFDLITNKIIIFYISNGFYNSMNAIAVASYSLLIIKIVDTNEISITLAFSILISSLFGNFIGPIICAYIINFINIINISLLIINCGFLISMFLFLIAYLQIKENHFVELV